MWLLLERERPALLATDHAPPTRLLSSPDLNSRLLAASELELNCLNTIWELLLHKPYKDGHALENPYNLPGLRTAVFVDGVTNAPETACTKWSVEAAFALPDLVQFDASRRRSAAPGDVWRVNFSRVQYELTAVVDADTRELRYAKVPDSREANIVWAPTGVVDIHRPEKWGLVFFSSQEELPGGEAELASAMAEFLREQLAMERVLDTIYYDQRAFRHRCGGFASTWTQLYPDPTAFAHADLLVQFQLSEPTIACESELSETITTRGGGDTRTPSASAASTPRDGADVGSVTPRRRVYVPALDMDDGDAEDPLLSLLSPRSREIRRREAAGVFRTFTATVTSATQQWNVAHDARVWKTT